MNTEFATNIVDRIKNGDIVEFLTDVLGNRVCSAMYRGKYIDIRVFDQHKNTFDFFGGYKCEEVIESFKNGSYTFIRFIESTKTLTEETVDAICTYRKDPKNIVLAKKIGEEWVETDGISSIHDGKKICEYRVIGRRVRTQLHHYAYAAKGRHSSLVSDPIIVTRSRYKSAEAAAADLNSLRADPNDNPICASSFFKIPNLNVKDFEEVEYIDGWEK